jgi:hypothetical protein
MMMAVLIVWFVQVDSGPIRDNECALNAMLENIFLMMVSMHLFILVLVAVIFVNMGIGVPKDLSNAFQGKLGSFSIDKMKEFFSI